MDHLLPDLLPLSCGGYLLASRVRNLVLNRMTYEVVPSGQNYSISIIKRNEVFIVLAEDVMCGPYTLAHSTRTLVAGTQGTAPIPS